jgi:type IV pilus assembly protein PilA
MAKLRQRLGSEQGFTLIELLVVIVIIGILLAIAVPSYLGFKDRAEKRSAQSNVRAAVPSVEAYYSDYTIYADDTTPPTGLPNGEFNSSFLQDNYDAGLKVETINSNASGTQYCISAVSGDWRAKLIGPGDNEVQAGKTSGAGSIAACVNGA